MIACELARYHLRADRFAEFPMRFGIGQRAGVFSVRSVAGIESPVRGMPHDRQGAGWYGPHAR